MQFLEKIKGIFFDVINDLKSCLIHVNDLVIRSSSKDKKIFLATVILFIVLIFFRSDSIITFHTNILILLFFSLVSYFIYNLSDYFWFLIKKRHIYQLNLTYKKNINILLKEILKKKYDNPKFNFQDEINSVVQFYSYGYKTHAKRYAIEILVILLILLFTFPLFFLFNLAIFFGMFFYVFLREGPSVDQAFNDIALLLYCINGFYRENPEECKIFITKSKKEEIRDLNKLYNAVGKIV